MRILKHIINWTVWTFLGLYAVVMIAVHTPFVQRKLGDSIAQVIVRNFPCPQEYVAVDDKFGESGTPSELLKTYHLTEEDIVNAALKAIARKA